MTSCAAEMKVSKENIRKTFLFHFLFLFIYFIFCFGRRSDFVCCRDKRDIGKYQKNFFYFIFHLFISFFAAEGEVTSSTTETKVSKGNIRRTISYFLIFFIYFSKCQEVQCICI